MCVCVCMCPPGVLESVWVWSAASAGSFICSLCWAPRMCGHWWCRGKGDGQGPWPTLLCAGRDRQHEEARVFSHCEEAILVGLHCKDLGAGHFYGRWPREAKSGGRETEIGKEEKPSMCVLMKGYCGGPQKLSPLGTLWGPMMSHWEGQLGVICFWLTSPHLGAGLVQLDRPLGRTAERPGPCNCRWSQGCRDPTAQLADVWTSDILLSVRGATEALKQRSEMTPVWFVKCRREANSWRRWAGTESRACWPLGEAGTRSSLRQEWGTCCQYPAGLLWARLGKL